MKGAWLRSPQPGAGQDEELSCEGHCHTWSSSAVRASCSASAVHTKCLFH